MNPDDLAPVLCLALATLLILGLAGRVWLELRRARRISDARRRRQAGRQAEYLMSCECGHVSWEKPPPVPEGECWRAVGKRWAWSFKCDQCRRRKAG